MITYTLQALAKPYLNDNKYNNNNIRMAVKTAYYENNCNLHPQNSRLYIWMCGPCSKRIKFTFFADRDFSGEQVLRWEQGSAISRPFINYDIPTQQPTKQQTDMRGQSEVTLPKIFTHLCLVIIKENQNEKSKWYNRNKK